MQVGGGNTRMIDSCTKASKVKHYLVKAKANPNLLWPQRLEQQQPLEGGELVAPAARQLRRLRCVRVAEVLPRTEVGHHGRLESAQRGHARLHLQQRVPRLVLEPGGRRVGLRSIGERRLRVKG